MNTLLVIVGFPGSGKSSYVKKYIDQGYVNFNRDKLGGNLEGIATKVDEFLKNNKSDIVVDNTYCSIDSRKSIIEVGKKHKMDVICEWLTTSLEETQINVCRRLINKGFKCDITLEEIKKAKDPNVFPPHILFSYRKSFEKPTLHEGFTMVNEIPFVRIWGSEYINKALILDYDGTLRESTGKFAWPINVSDVKILPNRIETLNKYKENGYLLLGASNQSCISKGLNESIAVACFEETNRQLGLSIDYMYCKHKIPPISCYCRKPHAGMGVTFIEKYKLNPTECIMVGDQTTDKTFAERCGFQFSHANEFFNT